MKNKLLLSVLVLSLIAFVYSCKKDVFEESPRKTDQSDTYAKMIIKKINNFRNLMTGVNYKTDGQMELDSAIWYLEATLSYDNAYPDSASKDFIIYSSFYTIPVDNDSMVDESDVQIVYDLMEDSLYYYLDLINEDYKFIAFADVQLNSIEGNNANLEMLSGYSYNMVLGKYTPFEEDDDWIWGTLTEYLGDPPAGKCDGTMYGVSDGSNELEWRFNHPWFAPAPQNHSGYTDYETVVVAGGEEVINENGDDMIYYDPTCTVYNCMENDALTFYLIQGDDLIYECDDPGTWWTEGVKPEGKSFISIEIVDELLLGDAAYLHKYEITYAKPIPGLPD